MKKGTGMRRISIGAQSFEMLRENGAFYIDKTSFIKEWWGSLDQVTLITRPRRFGKTLNMQMLECFFSNRYRDRSDLFEGLDIWKDEKYRQMQGTYPVIFISFANVKEKDFENARIVIVRTLQSAFNRYRYLWAGDDNLTSEDYSFVRLRPTMSDAEITTSINQLSEFLEDCFGKKVIILLDEYDTPMQEAYVKGYWNQMSEFMRALFNATFKTNASLEKAIMTGITRVSKESVFSDLNNPNVVTTTTSQYETAFGFTEKEVFDALEEYGMSDKKIEVKEWYDGFTFGDVTDIYNPWSITNFLRKKKFDTYWANTSSGGLINREIRAADDSTKDKVQLLIEGGSVRSRIDEQIIFDQLDGSEEALWSLLLASGYLKISGKTFDGFEELYDLTLTNKEVRLSFKKMIADWFSGAGTNYGKFMRSLLEGKVDDATEYLNNVLLNMASFFDTKSKVTDNQKPESFYHGLVLGMVAQETEYHIESNGDSGFGRYDIMMIPVNNRLPKDSDLPAVIIEFKIFEERKEKDLDDTAGRALAQIEDRKYETKLVDMGFDRDRILKYGFGFSGKEVKIKKA